MERLTGAHGDVTVLVATMGLNLAACAAVVRAFDVVLAEADELARRGGHALSDVFRLVDGDAVEVGQLCGLDLTRDCGKSELRGGTTLAGTGDVLVRLGKSRVLLCRCEVHAGDVVGLVEIGGELVVLVDQSADLRRLERGVADEERLKRLKLLHLSLELSDLGVLRGDADSFKLCGSLELGDLTALAVRLGREEEDRVLGVLLGGGNGNGLHDVLLDNGRVVGRGVVDEEAKDGVDLRHDGLRGNIDGSVDSVDGGAGEDKNTITHEIHLVGVGGVDFHCITRHRC